MSKNILQALGKIDAALGGQTDDASNVIDALDQISERSKELKNSIDNIDASTVQQMEQISTEVENEALKAEGVTLGKQNGVDVESDSPYYHANTKYYSEQAQATYDQVVAIKNNIPADYTALSDEVTDLKADLSKIEPGLSDDAKAALLACFSHVAWSGTDGKSYYDALESALYDIYPKITATFNPGTHPVYTDDTLDSLKPYITVKYYTSKEDTGTTVPGESYTLSGTLVEGTNLVNVSYQSLQTSISVNNVVNFYNIHEWSMSNGLLKTTQGTIKTNATYGLTIATGASDRRTVGTNHGVCPYIDNYRGTALDIYPVPIPMTAKKCTLSITPSKSLISRGYRVFNGEKYGSAISWETFTQGPLVIDLPEMAEQYYIQICTQYESGSTTYPEEIEEFTIVFED